MKSCPPTERLEAFLDEHLDGAEGDTIGAHVAACKSCQAILEGLTEAPERLRQPLSSVRRPADSKVTEANGGGSSASFLGLLKEVAGESLRRPPAGPVKPPSVAGYEVLSEVGRGGMGVVYRARQLGLNRLVALKMILAGDHAAPRELVRFRAEAEAAAQLRHPNIVQINEIGEAEGRPYFAMEFVEGGNLVQHLQGRPQSPEGAARLIETLARAVHYAHQRGIVHRDLKPANVLLAVSDASQKRSGAQRFCEASLNEAVPKITDFGLAKRLDRQVVSTFSGEVVGTPSYMAPEQAAGKGQSAGVGPAADVWALGAILYECLTGRPPFKADSALETVLQVLHEEPVRPTRLRPGVPRDLETVCLKCLQKEPAKRYDTAEDFADELHRFLVGDPVRARPIRLPERAWKWARRRPFTASLLAGLVLAILLGFAGVTWQWRQAVEARQQEAEQARQAEQSRDKESAARYDAYVSRSQLQWRLNEFSGAVRTLNACRPELRGWEWHYLRGLYASELLSLHHPHPGRSGDVAVCPPRPGGRCWVASIVAGQEEVRIWGDNGELVMRLPASATAHRLVFRPDGSRLAVADQQGWVVVWDLATRRQVRRQRLHEKAIESLAYSPDGAWLATAGGDGAVRVWDIKSDRQRLALGDHGGRATAVTFTPDGTRLITAGQHHHIHIWDAQSGQKLYQLEGHRSAVRGLTCSRDGTYLASVGTNGTLRVWEMEPAAASARPPRSPSPPGLPRDGGRAGQPRTVQSLTGNAAVVLSVAFSPDGRFLAYGGSDATVRVWHRPTGVQRTVYRGHTAAVERVLFSADGRRLVSCAPGEGSVKVWDVTRHPEYATLARTYHPEYDGPSRTWTWPEPRVWNLLRAGDGPKLEHTGPDVEAMAFQDNGRRLVSVTVGGRLQTWEADSGLLLDERRLPLGADLISPAVLANFNADGSLLAGRTPDARVVGLWDAATGRELLMLRGHRHPVFAVRFSPNGQLLATAGGLKCGMRNAECGRLSSFFLPRSAVPVPHAHELLVWDVATGEQLARREGTGHVFNLAFSPDGRWLAVGGEAGQVRVLEWASGKQVLGGQWHQGAVTALAFGQAAGKPLLLATTGADDRTVQVRECDSGRPRKPLPLPQLLCDLTFSPDGRRLAGICRDRVKLWDVDAGEELLTLRGAPPRLRDPAFNPRLVFSPDGSRLAGSNWDESISVWEAADPDPERQAARRRAAERRAPLWHLEEAERCVRVGNEAAARFHLGQLGAGPLPRWLQERKDHLVRQLAVRP
jgi:WD40 repeat protein/serine/threonine protein kinase